MPLVFEVACDIPSELYPGRCEGFEEYITLREQLCYDYRHPPDLRHLYIRGQRSVRENPPERLKYGLMTDDGPLMLEYCLRALAVCHPLIRTGGHVHEPSFTAKRLAGVEITDSEEATLHFPKIKNVTLRLRLQGLACYAHMAYLGSVDRLEPLSYSCLLRGVMIYACNAANMCVSLDFIPPIALRIASWLATTEARFGLDVRSTNKFRDLRHLWHAHSSYISRLQTKDAARLKKIAKTPHLYRCATPGCPIQAMSKSALLRCGGSCLSERKPRYCSHDCQRQHWRLHREFCKPGNTCDYPDIIADDGDPDWLDVDELLPPATRNIHPCDSIWPLFADREGDEIFVDIQNDSPFRKGDIIRVKTRTLSPMCLKAYHATWASLKPATGLKLRTFVEKMMISPPPNMGFPAPKRDLDSLEPW
ncbi:hypothetical protein C2E23DRAFT_933667 [Lenzites betulinus]|nr:hypothetical protein C2E23DRAFT_933667 [Lenzites betulinus]